MTMLSTLALVPPDEAHAGDLIGFTRAGRPILLPGGGARDGEIVADDGDEDEEPQFEETDEDDDETDDEPPAPAAKGPRKPTYKELMEANRRLEQGNRRNNAELKQRRLLGDWMAQHNIEDLDAWLAQQGIDKTTAQASGNGHVQQPQAQQEEAIPPAQVSDAEIRRRVDLEVERRMAEHDTGSTERITVLESVLAQQAVENHLIRLGFSGKPETAMRVVDLASVSVSDDGTVSGAAEAAASLKDEIPDWFKPARRPAPVRTGGAEVDGGDKPPKQPSPPRWDQRIVDRLRGGG